MKLKISFIVSSAIIFVFSISFVWAMSPIGANYHLATPGTERSLFLPETADRSPVISLGDSVDWTSGKKVSGYAIIHYAKGGKKGPPDGNSGNKNQCYGFLAKGAKWKTVEPWIVNTDNNSGLDSSFVLNNLGYNISKWEDASDGSMDGVIGADILGDGSLVADVLAVDTSSPDGKNEVYFADISSSGAIGVTIVWGIFSGPPSQRELVEWDQIYDDVDYDWSENGESEKMDFENIATHELGHSLGLDDLYDSQCGEETMYGYADFGETKKRYLNVGDIAGVSTLY